MERGLGVTLPNSHIIECQGELGNGAVTVNGGMLHIDELSMHASHHADDRVSFPVIYLKDLTGQASPEGIRDLKGIKTVGGMEVGMMGRYSQ